MIGDYSLYTGSYLLALPRFLPTRSTRRILQLAPYIGVIGTASGGIDIMPFPPAQLAMR